MSNKKNFLEWSTLFTVIGAAVAIIALILSLRDDLQSRMDSYVQQSRQEMNQFRDEMKHFYGKQCSLEFAKR